MSSVARKRLLYCLIIVAGLSEPPLLIRVYRETNEFMSAAQTVRADVIQDPLSAGRLVRFQAANQVVTIPLENIVDRRSINAVGNQIEIAYLPERPNEPRWIAKIERFRAGLPWLMTLSIALILFGSALFWRTLATTAPQPDPRLIEEMD